MDYQEPDYKTLDAEAERQYAKDMQANIARGGIDKAFFGAYWQARNSIRDNGLLPSRDRDGEWRYGAICHTKESRLRAMREKTRLRH